jgi:hypothetical protein
LNWHKPDAVSNPKVSIASEMAVLEMVRRSLILESDFVNGQGIGVSGNAGLTTSVNIFSRLISRERE